MDELTAEEKLFYADSTGPTKGVPHETVTIDKPPSEFYTGDPSGWDDVRMDQLGLFFMRTFAVSMDNGTFPKTLAHYVKQAEVSETVDGPMLGQLKELAKEAHDNRFDEKALAVTHKKVAEVCGKMRVVRRDK